jgi:hypothetical protein
MYEEDIDAILARAEVVDEHKGGPNDGTDALLSSFNVATFKNEEDDATFWNRLIPVNERKKARAAPERVRGWLGRCVCLSVSVGPGVCGPGPVMSVCLVEVSRAGAAASSTVGAASARVHPSVCLSVGASKPRRCPHARGGFTLAREDGDPGGAGGT